MIRSIKIKEVDDPLLDKVKGTYKVFPSLRAAQV